jgi:hypothetical protein
MKKSYLFLLGLVAFGASATAQTKVIFRVDMRNETVSSQWRSHSRVTIRLLRVWPPIGFLSDAACEAKDPDNDKVFELQVTLAPGTYQYKYIK